MFFNKSLRKDFKTSISIGILHIIFELGVLYLLILLIKSILINITDTIKTRPVLTIIALFLILIIVIGKNLLLRLIDYLQYGQVKLSKIQLETILKTLTPRQFEYFCAEFFRLMGHKSELMPDGPDGGKDVVLDGKVYVECKRYNVSVIGSEICQKLLGAVEADGMEKGIIFTNGKVHQTGFEVFAKTKRLELWNIDTIYVKLNSLENHKISLLLDESLKYYEESKKPDPELQPE